ncbi:anion permease [Escherichia coli]
MGKRTLTLGYAIVIIDILLAPFTPSNTAHWVRFFRSLKTCRRCLIIPNDPSARRIGGYLMWMMVISTSLSSSMFVTGAAPNVLGLEFVSKIAAVSRLAGCSGSASCRLGLSCLSLRRGFLVALYKPEITHSEEVATWAGDELKTMGASDTQRVDTDWPCIAQLRFVGIWQ